MNQYHKIRPIKLYSLRNLCKIRCSNKKTESILDHLVKICRFSKTGRFCPKSSMTPLIWQNSEQNTKQNPKTRTLVDSVFQNKDFEPFEYFIIQFLSISVHVIMRKNVRILCQRMTPITYRKNYFL